MGTVTGRPADRLLPVTGVFLTHQGEGPSTGQLATFVRLGGCNLTCSWCDTPYTWDASRYDLRAEILPRPVDEVLADVRGHGAGLVVITGGEPLLHQDRPGFTALVTGLDGHTIEVETNGTRVPAGYLTARARFNVSPKLAHSGDPHTRRLVPAALAAFAAHATAGRAVFKFVVATPGDVDTVEQLVGDYAIPRDAVWLMGQAGTAAQVLDTARPLAARALDAGFHFTLRSHLLIWGTDRNR